MMEFTKPGPPPRLRGTEFETIDAITSRIIACAIEVHRVLGPGLLEAMYDAALRIELSDRWLHYARQIRVPAQYKGRSLGHYCVDLIVEELVVVEIKSVVTLLPIYEAQVLTYLRLTGKRVGLLMNFNSRLMKHGIRRFVL